MTDNQLVAQISDPHLSVRADDTASARALGPAVEEGTEQPSCNPRPLSPGGWLHHWWSAAGGA